LHGQSLLHQMHLRTRRAGVRFRVRPRPVTGRFLRDISTSAGHPTLPDGKRNPTDEGGVRGYASGWSVNSESRAKTSATMPNVRLRLPVSLFMWMMSSDSSRPSLMV